MEHIAGKSMLDGQLNLIFNLLLRGARKSGVAAATGGST